MNLEELRRIREEERAKDSLQDLHEDFYEEVGTYIDELRHERDEAAANAPDPFNDETVQRLSDELGTAERIVEALYERRVGKIVKRASFEAADMGGDRGGMTAEEQELCEAIVARIRENRERVLDTVSTTDAQPAQEDLDPYHRGQESPADQEESASTTDKQTSDQPEEDDDTARTTVRITQDIGEIVGIDDRAYELETDDIVSLPTINAKPLLERGVAEPLD